MEALPARFQRQVQAITSRYFVGTPNPIITVGIFVFLNRAGILNIGETSVPYPIFALMGISIYGIFSTGLSVCSNSIIGAGSMVVKINFPKISLVIASMGQSLVDF